MSHFTVGIIVKNKEDLEFRLARYAEQDPDYYEQLPYMTKEEYIKLYKEYHKDMDFTNITDEEIWRTKAPEEYNSDEIDLDGGMIYTYYNPNAKWDWYEIGGRWANSLKTRKDNQNIICGSHYSDNIEPKGKGRYRWVDGAKIKDICWTDMNKLEPKDLKRHSEFWDNYVEGKDTTKDYGFVYKSEYYKDLYKTKENFIMKQSLFYTHDLLFCPEDESDEWISIGDMGWFGVDGSNTESMDNFLERFYDIINDPKYKDYWFVVVDCHV